MNISYEYYKVFYQVAKCKSISAAAAVLHKGQPNLTKLIATLEGQLGCRLFLRSTKGVQLTPEGKKLYEHISVAVEQIQAGEAELLADRSLQSVTITIACSEIALRCCLLPVLESYRRQYPGVKLHLSNLSGPQAVETVQREEADFAVVTGPLSLPEEIQFLQVGQIQQVAVGGSKFRPYTWEPMTLEGLAELPLVCMHPNTVTFRFLNAFFARNGIPFRPEIEVATADQLLPIIRSNLAVGFVPEEYFRGEEGIFPLNLQQTPPVQEILLLRSAGTRLSPPAEKLRALLESAWSKKEPSPSPFRWNSP